MNQKQNKYLLWLAALCMAACMVLTVGVTFARYQSEIDLDSLWFSAEVADRLHLCDGHMTQSQMNSGSWSGRTPAWTETEEGLALEFCISNGTSGESFATRDQMASVRLAAGLGIQDPETLTVVLTFERDDQQVQLTAVPELIEEGSALYYSFGDGWLYRFYEEDAEAAFLFDGEELSYQNFTLTVAGETEAALLDLQILGQYHYELS